MNMKTSENELDILNILRKLDDAENNIREEKNLKHKLLWLF